MDSVGNPHSWSYTNGICYSNNHGKKQAKVYFEKQLIDVFSMSQTQFCYCVLPH